MKEDLRKKENEALIEKMRKGESLATVSVKATWWPPRPIIKKDLALQKKLFSEKIETPVSQQETVNKN